MSIDSKLLEDFDEILHDRGYQTRSKGIKDALQDYIIRYQWTNEKEGEKFGTISITYDIHAIGVIKGLTDLQHKYRQYINSVMHVHITETQYLVVIVVKGDVNNLRELTEKIISLKGVEHVKLTSTGIKEH